MNSGTKTITIITTGLGAGSYPEPPDLPDEIPGCCMCGITFGLRIRDGHRFCKSCEDEFLYATSKQDDQWEFIKSSYDISKEFLLNHWWEGLNETTKMVIVEHAFNEMYLPIHCKNREEALKKQMDKRVEISIFVRDRTDEYGDWYRKQEGPYV